MKKITVLLSGMALVFGLAACGSRQQEKDVPVLPAEPVLETESGETDLESSGQTEAEQENFENSEQNGHVLIACFSVPEDADARPELATHIENPERYDTIILGVPNWWADLPMPVYTFLEEYDFGGKTIIPFVTHGGSGFSRIPDTISQLQPDACVSENTLSLSRNSVADSKEEVAAWAESLGLNAAKAVSE